MELCVFANFNAHRLPVKLVKNVMGFEYTIKTHIITEKYGIFMNLSSTSVSIKRSLFFVYFIHAKDIRA